MKADLGGMCRWNSRSWWLKTQ